MRISKKMSLLSNDWFIDSFYAAKQYHSDTTMNLLYLICSSKDFNHLTSVQNFFIGHYFQCLICSLCCLTGGAVSFHTTSTNSTIKLMQVSDRSVDIQSWHLLTHIHPPGPEVCHTQARAGCLWIPGQLTCDNTKLSTYHNTLNNKWRWRGKDCQH